MQRAFNPFVLFETSLSHFISSTQFPSSFFFSFESLELFVESGQTMFMAKRHLVWLLEVTWR
jgi:hypothetical protein